MTEETNAKKLIKVKRTDGDTIIFITQHYLITGCKNNNGCIKNQKFVCKCEECKKLISYSTQYIRQCEQKIIHEVDLLSHHSCYDLVVEFPYAVKNVNTSFKFLDSEVILHCEKITPIKYKITNFTIENQLFLAKCCYRRQIIVEYQHETNMLGKTTSCMLPIIVKGFVTQYENFGDVLRKFNLGENIISFNVYGKIE